MVPAALAIVLALVPPATAQQTPDGPEPDAADADLAAQALPESDTGLYIVRFTQPAVASYAGGIAGLAPTSPHATGADRLDPGAPASVAYRDYLESVQATATTRFAHELARDVEVHHQYTDALNGLAVAVDAAEAAQLAGLPQVAAVYPDREQELLTDVSHDLIGTAAFWDGGTGPGLATRGEGVVVGMLDSGVNGAHPSFATVDGEGFVHTNPLGEGVHLGVCAPDHPQHEPICTEKLIGAYNFHPGAPGATDQDDHGSHVGSTIAGNLHEATFTLGQDAFTRTVQGVAPRANVVSFLVCSPGCPSSSSVAAVNQAIQDGVVDVLNFSISGVDDPWNDPVDLAFLDAFEAGIYVSASAGNDGPGPSTVAKTGPWNASVAASSHQRVFAHTLDTLGPEPVPGDLLDLPAFPSSDGPQVTVDLAGELRLVEDNPLGCDPFPAGAFDGALALVRRGDCTFATKVENATDAGADAVVIFNNVAGPPSAAGGLADTAIPAVMIEQGPGNALRDFVLAGDEPTVVRISAQVQLFLDPDAWEDVVAGFSSRGPSRHHVLAPTFTAPGVNILAAAREVDAGPDNYTVVSGTSMSSPHGAGAAALLMALHPDWSLAQVRSALAGTADPGVLVKEDGLTPADPFDQGSGRLDLGVAAAVGLVLDETHANFVAANPDEGGDPRTLNLPALVDHNCVAECTWTRTFTSVADATASYGAVVQETPGLTVTADPATFTIAPGGSQTVTFTASAPGLAAAEFRFGDVALVTGDSHASGAAIPAVHYPVVVGLEPPTLELDPEEVTAELGPDEQGTATLTIGNAGGEVLEWELVELAPTGALAQPLRAPSLVLWNQPPSGTGGIISDFYHELQTGVYAADDFTVPAEVAIELIHTDGFWNDGSLAQATALSWFIYPDADGVPAGHPEDGQDTHAFTFTSTPDGDGVSIEDDNLTLDVVAATGGPATLPAGRYWLTVFPDIDGPCCPGATRWNWQQAAQRQAEAHLVDPGDLFGGGTDWRPFSEVGLAFTGTAFRLEGAIDCTPGDIPWLSVSPRGGAVDPLGSDQVTFELDSTGLPPGDHHGSFCLFSNDPDRQVSIVPVTLSVAPPAAAIEVTPAALAAEVPAGQALDQALTISNSGTGVLDWSITVAEPAAPQQSTVLFDQPRNGTGGILSDFFTGAGGGVYTADDFVLAGPALVEQIHAEGFRNAGDLTQAEQISWYIYPDAGGVPAGNPEDGLDTHVFAHSAPATGPGVDVTAGDITLDLVAATGEPLPLPAGTYWLTVFPHLAVAPNDGDGRWHWFQAAQQGSQAVLIDPQGALVPLPDWTPLSLLGLAFTGTAFRLEGAAGCVPAAVPWLAVAPASGTTPPGASSAVTITLDASTLAPGDYSATVCVHSNDPATPVVEVPVTLTVVDGDPAPACDRVIEGTHAGPLTVDQGVTCLAAGAVVLGPVNVLPGAGLVSVAATVQGPVGALPGAAILDLAVTTVSGPVVASGVTDRLSLISNQVSGPVVLSNNHTGTEPIVVAGNVVIGVLVCHGNQPPPTDLGLPNPVTGPAVGQCADL